MWRAEYNKAKRRRERETEEVKVGKTINGIAKYVQGIGDVREG